MFDKATLLAGATVALLAAPAVAIAAPAHVTGDLSLRSGPGTQYHRIAVIPAGARIETHGCSSWCHVSYRGLNGYASASYIARGSVTVQRPAYRRPPPPHSGWARRPWWDDRHNAWHDGRRWYYGGQWHKRPNGFYFGFGFGG